MWTSTEILRLATASGVRALTWHLEDFAMSDRDDTLQPDDFPIEAERSALKTTDGKTIAEAKTKQLADEIANRLNEQAYREEQDCWSA
jgi:hypothetical protein